MKQAQDTTVYIRGIGKKTWKKYYSQPISRVEAEELKLKIEKQGYCEIKLCKAGKGKINNY